MGKIIIEDIKIYAYHGHMPEENKIGSWYLINLDMDVALEDACNSDHLEDTVDYSIAYEIIEEEMKIPSKLLEHVAGRILTKLFAASQLIWAAKIRVSKLNPPFGGNVSAVSVELQKERNQ